MNMLALGKNRGNPYTSGSVPENFSIPKSSWSQNSVPDAAPVTNAMRDNWKFQMETLQEVSIIFESAVPESHDLIFSFDRLSQEKMEAYRKKKTLEELLAKNKAKIAELERQQRGTTARCAELNETHKLQKDIEKRLNEIHQDLESIQNRMNKLKGLPPISTTSKSDVPKSNSFQPATPSAASSSRNDDAEDSKFDYFDDGNHICQVCDEVFPKMDAYLEHLLGEKHWKVLIAIVIFFIINFVVFERVSKIRFFIFSES